MATPSEIGCLNAPPPPHSGNDLRQAKGKEENYIQTPPYVVFLWRLEMGVTKKTHRFENIRIYFGYFS